MALEDKMKKAPAEDDTPEGMTRLSDEDEMSLDIAVLLGKKLVDEGGAEVLQAAETSSDPGQVVGQFLMQLGSQLAEKMPPEVQLPPTIFLAKGGWLEQMSDFLQEEYDMPREIMDRAEIYVASTAQQMAQNNQAGGAPAPGGGPAETAAPVAAPPVMPGGMQ